MARGRFLVGEHDGVYVLRLTGDVRVTLGAAIDGYLERMFSDEAFQSVLVDLCAAEGIDSTTLGILAKLSLQAERRFHFKPTLLCTRRDLLRQLEVMGFDDIFVIRQESAASVGLLEVPADRSSDEEERLRVLEAHRTLMALNADNEKAFAELVHALEAETPSHSASG